MEWQQVKKKERRNPGRNASKPVGQTEEEVKTLLATFKTTKCTIEDVHDHRPCVYFHDPAKDRRRNPYDEYYTVDECQNSLERMFHPEVFRTGVLCKRAASLTCLFGRNCAHAHSLNEVRDREIASREYENLPVLSRPRVALDSFIPAAPEKLDYDFECRALWSQLKLKPQARFVPLQAHEWFIIQRSESLFNSIKQIAFEEGCGTVSRDCQAGKQGLVLQGIHVDDIQMRIASILTPPSQYFFVKRDSLGERVVESLKNSNNWAGPLERSNDVHIQFFGSGEIQVAAVHSRDEKAEDSVQRVFDTIQFWVDREGYGTYRECGCCGENRNEDQGVACTNGHFYCSVGEEEDWCFAVAVSSQIIELRSREEGLVCPDCHEPYEMQKIASHLPAPVWEGIQKAIIDKEVERQTEILANEFDERLKEKVLEVLQKYGDADDMLRLEAQRVALEVRNTILNLSCPHCNIAYSEFSGCMALQCTSCRGHFCGYCHYKAANGMGAHDHVRQCLMNETDNATYFASPEQITKAQKKYRTRELKKFLRKFKKDKQNAIVIELQRDLADLGIKAEALFEVGNLQC